MNFDYKFATESTFIDWVNAGTQKAEAILDLLDESGSENDIHCNSDEKNTQT